MAVMAGAAAGMLASRNTTIATADPNQPSVVPPTATVGESVDQFADSAGQVLARTIKEQVPQSIRTAPAPGVTKPARTPTPALSTPVKAKSDDAPW